MQYPQISQDWFKGEHAIMLPGGLSRVLRHDTARNLIAKAGRKVDYRTDIERGGGLQHNKRPGDVIIYCW